MDEPSVIKSAIDSFIIESFDANGLRGTEMTKETAGASDHSVKTGRLFYILSQQRSAGRSPSGEIGRGNHVTDASHACRHIEWAARAKRLWLSLAQVR